jgi:hypothetical protein
MRYLTIVAGALLAGCGGGDPAAACKDYLASYNDCVKQAGADTSSSLPDSYCDQYDGLSGDAKKAAVDLFSCYSDALDSADCSTTDGLTAVGTAEASCSTAG